MSVGVGGRYICKLRSSELPKRVIILSLLMACREEGRHGVNTYSDSLNFFEKCWFKDHLDAKNGLCVGDGRCLL